MARAWGGWQLAAVLLVLGTAGCASAPAPRPPPTARVAEGSPLTFGAPVVALAGCGARSGSACFEPSVAVGAAGTLVANSYAAPLARQVTASLFLDVRGPGGAALNATGDALVQAAPDGSIWWSMLSAQQIHVARTTNAGLTWDVDATAPLEPPPDRQWLLFGPDRIVLTYQGSSVRAMVSADGGRTWSGTVAVAPQARVHGQGAWCGDRFLVPFLQQGRLGVAASLDGRAWSTSFVPAAAGTYFPALACDGPQVALAWQDPQQQLLLARSADLGRTWEAPLALNLAPQHVVGSPWLLLRGGKAWVAYFAADHDAGPAELAVVRVAGAVADRGVAATGIATTYAKARPGNTDFAHFGLDAGGHAVLAYADGDKSVKLVAQS